LWDQLPEPAKVDLLSFIRISENEHDNRKSNSNSQVQTDPIRVWTGDGSDYSYYDACGSCDGWTVCQPSSGPDVCIMTCAQHSDCFALFDSVRGRQYNGGCDISLKQCIGFKLQPRISGTLPVAEVNKFRAWSVGRGIVIDSTGVVTDWGKDSAVSLPAVSNQKMVSSSVTTSKVASSGGSNSGAASPKWTLSLIAVVVILYVNLIY